MDEISTCIREDLHKFIVSMSPPTNVDDLAMGCTHLTTKSTERSVNTCDVFTSAISQSEAPGQESFVNRGELMESIFSRFGLRLGIRSIGKNL